jgi:hypothetical protein
MNIANQLFIIHCSLFFNSVEHPKKNRETFLALE